MNKNMIFFLIATLLQCYGMENILPKDGDDINFTRNQRTTFETIRSY